MSLRFQLFSSKFALFNLISFNLLCRVNHRTMSFQANKDKYLSMSLEEKRKQYKCGSSYVLLSDIQKWSDSTETSDVEAEFKLNNDLNKKISLFNGDITKLEIDAIVNAANSRLVGGGGVDGFIHRAADEDLLQAECRTLNGCETGSCKMTGGYRLPSKYIIHCVGPVGEKPDLLSSCYKSALDLLVKNGLRSIAFPCISTGVYGYPNLNAAKVSLEIVRKWLEDSENADKIDRIIFCLFLEKDIEIYNRLLFKYFPK